MYKQQLDLPVAESASGRQILRYVADGTCLLIGALVFLWTHDILVFLLMYGIATGQILVREVISTFLHTFQHTAATAEELLPALSKDQAPLSNSLKQVPPAVDH